jgi:hypothetical protein
LPPEKLEPRIEVSSADEKKEQTNAITSKPKIIRKESIEKKQLLSAQKLSQKEPGVKQSTEQTVIEVGSKLSLQVDEYLQEWNTLCQLLVNDVPWETSFEQRKTILRNPLTTKIILEYERNSGKIKTSSPRLLYNILMRIVSEMATNKVIKTEYRLLARKWLLNLKNPPLDNNKALLAFLFNI